MCNARGDGVGLRKFRIEHGDASQEPFEACSDLRPLALVATDALQEVVVGALEPRAAGEERLLVRRRLLQQLYRLGSHSNAIRQSVVPRETRCQEKTDPFAPPRSPSNSAAVNWPASKGRRSSTASPTPTYRIGRPVSLRIAITTPPRAVPSSFVSTMPVTPIAS